MTDKELKKLSRKELLEMLVINTRRIEALEAKVKELQGKLNSRNITVERAGSLAEAALQLSGVFESAQKAAELYLENLKNCTPHAENSKDGDVSDE